MSLQPLPIFSKIEVDIGFPKVLYHIIFEYLSGYEQLVYNSLSIFNYKEGEYFVDQCLKDAAEDNNIEIVKFLFSPEILEYKALLTFTITYASIKSAKHTVDFLLSHGAPLTDNTCHYTAKANNLDMLRYLYNNGLTITREVIIFGVKHDNLDMVKFGCMHAEVHPYEEQVIVDSIEAQVESKDIRCLEYVLDRYINCISYSSVCVSLNTGNINIIKAFVSRTYEKYDETVYTIIDNCSLEIIKELIPRYFPVDDSVRDQAKIRGYTDIIDYLNSNRSS